MKTTIFPLITVLLIGLGLISMSYNQITQQDPWEVPAKYQKLKNPYLNASDGDQIGRILYAKHCKSCHGTKGKGDGKKAASLDTPAGDFTEDSFKEQTYGALYYKTYIGRDEMPSFDKKIPDAEDQWLLINYIKGL